MIVWDVLNSLMRLGIAVIIVWKLYRFSHMFNAYERYGMGIAGGASLLTITVIWDGMRSPYDGWGTTLFSFGILLYFTGRMTRHWRHERNNWLHAQYMSRRYDR
jgi:hypothetical protein